MTYLRFMGDDSGTVTSPAAVLTRQVNRYVKAPPAYQFVTAPLPVTDIVTPELALAAVLIYQRSATDSFTKFQDDGSRRAIEEANNAFANPVMFVSTHMKDVTNTVSNMAGLLGLPAPEGASTIGDMSQTTVLIIAGLAAVALLFMSKRGGG